MLPPDVATIRDLLDRLAQTRSDIPCLLSPDLDSVWSFAEFRLQAQLIARNLTNRGLAKGDKVAFLMDNGLFTASLLLGSMYGGFVPVPLNVRAGRNHLAWTLNHCDTRLVFVSQNYQTTLEDLLPEIGRPIQVIPADVDRGPLWDVDAECGTRRSWTSLPMTMPS